MILATTLFTWMPTSAHSSAAYSESSFPAVGGKISAAQTSDEITATAHLRFAHLAPTLDATDLYLNGLPVMRQLRVGEMTEWRAYAPTTYTLTTESSATAPPLVQFDLRDDEWLTLVIIDTEQGPTAQVIVEDYQPNPSEPSQARLTLVHAPGATGIVDVLEDGKVVVQTKAVTDTAITGIVDIPGGSHDLMIVDSADAETIYLETAGYNFVAMSNTFIAIYRIDDIPMMLLRTTMMPETAGGAQALLRVLHISSGTPPLDVYVDGQIQNTVVGGDGDTADLRFPEMSGWMVLPEGETNIIIAESGDSPDQPIMPAVTLELPQGSATTLTVIGATANNTLQAWPLQEDFSDVTSGLVRVGLFNAHPGAGPVDVTLDDGNVLASQLGYPGFFGDNDGFIESIVDEGAYEVEINSSEGQDALVTFPIELRSGRNYFLAIISANPPYYLTFSDLAETQELLRSSP